MTTMTLDPRGDARVAFDENGGSEAAKCNELDRAVSDPSFDRDLMERLATVRNLLRGRIVFTTSFGIEDQAIAHAIFEQALEIEVVTLDTGRLFPQTYELWAQTERRYGRRIPAFYPDRVSIESLVARQGIDGCYTSVSARHACCSIRKVEPLGRAIAGATAWIAGLRADQSDERAGISFAAIDPHHRLIKVNPLFDCSTSPASCCPISSRRSVTMALDVVDVRSSISRSSSTVWRPSVSRRSPSMLRTVFSQQRGANIL